MGFTKVGKVLSVLFAFGLPLLVGVMPALAGEADIVLPDLSNVNFTVFGGMLNGIHIMYFGLLVCVLGLVFALVQSNQTKNLPAHSSMLNVSDIIWETCKSYLAQQGKFLVILWVLIAICMTYYFVGLAGRARLQHSRHPLLLRPRHTRLLRRGLVRHEDQHPGQFPDRLRIALPASRSTWSPFPCAPA